MALIQAMPKQVAKVQPAKVVPKAPAPAAAKPKALATPAAKVAAAQTQIAKNNGTATAGKPINWAMVFGLIGAAGVVYLIAFK